MPISFPPPARGRSAIQARTLYRPPTDYVPVENIANPGIRFNLNTLKGGRGRIEARMNHRNPGVNFAKTFQTPLDPRPQVLRDPAIPRGTRGTLKVSFTGISRDSAGAPLGSCTVMIFRTTDRVLVGETVSDGSGNWTIIIPVSGPFFQVDYKVSAPDVTGASLNTLFPVVVPV